MYVYDFASDISCTRLGLHNLWPIGPPKDFWKPTKNVKDIFLYVFHNATQNPLVSHRLCHVRSLTMPRSYGTCER